MISIYGLRDWDQNLRYVGKTAQKLSIRLGQHIRQARRKKNLSHCQYWIRSLPQPPSIELIALVPDSEWQAAEKHYIAHARALGCDLTNITPGGECGPVGLRSPLKGRKQTPEFVEKRIGPLRGRKQPPEIAQRLRTQGIGKKDSEATRKRKAEAGARRGQTEQQKAGLVKAKAASLLVITGKPQTPEKKEKTRKANCATGPRKDNSTGRKGVSWDGYKFLPWIKLKDQRTPWPF